MSSTDELTREERRDLFLQAATSTIERALTGELGDRARRAMLDACREAARAAWYDVLAGATISMPAARGVGRPQPATMHAAPFDPDNDPDISPPLTADERAASDAARQVAASSWAHRTQGTS